MRAGRGVWAGARTRKDMPVPGAERRCGAMRSTHTDSHAAPCASGTTGVALRQSLLPGRPGPHRSHDRKGLESQGHGWPCLARPGCNAWGGHQEVSGWSTYSSSLGPSGKRRSLTPLWNSWTGWRPWSYGVLAPHAPHRAAGTARAAPNGGIRPSPSLGRPGILPLSRRTSIRTHVLF